MWNKWLIIELVIISRNEVKKTVLKKILRHVDNRVHILICASIDIVSSEWKPRFPTVRQVASRCAARRQ